MTRKVRKSSKNLIFSCFQMLKMHMFARSNENRSKIDEVKAGPHQIDPRGSHGANNSARRSYGAGYDGLKMQIRTLI